MEYSPLGQGFYFLWRKPMSFSLPSLWLSSLCILSGCGGSGNTSGVNAPPASTKDGDNTATPNNLFDMRGRTSITQQQYLDFSNSTDPGVYSVSITLAGEVDVEADSSDESAVYLSDIEYKSFEIVINRFQDGVSFHKRCRDEDFIENTVDTEEAITEIIEQPLIQGLCFGQSTEQRYFKKRNNYYLDVACENQTIGQITLAKLQDQIDFSFGRLQLQSEALGTDDSSDNVCGTLTVISGNTLNSGDKVYFQESRITLASPFQEGSIVMDVSLNRAIDEGIYPATTNILDSHEGGSLAANAKLYSPGLSNVWGDEILYVTDGTFNLASVTASSASGMFMFSLADGEVLQGDFEFELPR